MKTALSVALILAASTALAQQPAAPAAGSSPSKTFETLDTNADGRLSLTEAQVDASLASKFSMLDKQGKGFITKDEYQSYIKDGGKKSETPREQ